MGAYTHRLTLQVVHDSADLSHVPALLGLPADRLRHAGELYVAPDGNTPGHRNRHSRCSFHFDAAEGVTVSAHIAAIVERLKPHREAMRTLSDSGTSFSFFIGWFSDANSRDVFDWALLEDLAALRISLDLDIYGPEKLDL